MLEVPQFVANPTDRGNTYVTFSWANSVTGKVVFPHRKPFIQCLQDAIPRLGEFVILLVDNKHHMFEVLYPPTWCGNNVLIELNYRDSVQFVPPPDYTAKAMPPVEGATG